MKKLVTLVIICLAILYLINPCSLNAAEGKQQEVSAVIKQLIDNAGGTSEYPNADSILIIDDTVVDYQANGDYISTEHSLVKILTETGKERNATLEFGYHKRYQEISIPLARVIYPDGSCLDIPPESIKDGTMASTQEMNIFEENFRQKSVTIPDLAVGCSIEYKVQMKTHQLLKDNYTEMFYFQGTYPVLRSTVRINGPANRPLKFIVKNGELTFTKKEENGRIIYYWEALNVPQIISEPDQVPLSDVALKLVVSTFSSWQELSRFGDSLNEGKVDMSPQLKETVKKLTSNLTTDREKTLAIFRYVSQKIRYMGSSMDVGAFIEPHKATYTFEKQYGVCRDKSILMAAMLKEVGIDSYDTLINVSSKTIKEIPTVYFEHAIIAVVLKDGSLVYMDPTLELSSSFGETYVGDKEVLLLSKEGEDLRRAPHVPAAKSLGIIEAHSELDASGTLKGAIKVSGIGFYDLVLRSTNQSYHAVQFERVMQWLATQFHPKTEVGNVQSQNPIDLDTPYHFSFDFITREYPVEAGDFTLLHLPLSSCTFDLVVEDIFTGDTKLKKRKYPMGIFSTRACRQIDRLTIPEGYKIVSLPPELAIKEGPISLTTKSTIKEATIEYSIDYRLEKSRLSPEDYQDLRKVGLQLIKFGRSYVILEKI